MSQLPTKSQLLHSPHLPLRPSQTSPGLRLCQWGRAMLGPSSLSGGNREAVCSFPNMATGTLKRSPEEYGTSILIIIFLSHVSCVLGLQVMSSFSLLLFQPYPHAWSLGAYSSVLVIGWSHQGLVGLGLGGGQGSGCIC